ncbi:MAG: DUF1841 family protein [Deltaproteobacteria bacterium]|nr:DUF1841 family protein [Deltaproteobacteria bacterium]
MTKKRDVVYQFKVTLKGIRPPVWRRIQVPGDYSFWDLHVALQDAMGWLDEHLHSFTIRNPQTGEEERIGIPCEEYGWDLQEEIPGWERKIARYFNEENPKAGYTYDFGDDWRHEVKMEKILPREKEGGYPRCLAGRRSCPPEDCGGVWGYEDLLHILSDPDHEEYESTREWVGEYFGPEQFDPKEVDFWDPRERWSMAFKEEDFDEEASGRLRGPADDYQEEDQDLLGRESEDEDPITRSIRIQSRRQMHDLWKKARHGDMEDLSSEERRFAEAMLEHEGEYFNDFEFADLTEDHIYDPDMEVSPFLHIAMHAAVEAQIAEREPLEAFQFLNAMLKKKCPRHEAIHLIAAVFAPLMFHSLFAEKPFDNQTYRDLLKKYKTRNPEKISDLLEKEPRIYFDEKEE